MRKDSKIVDKTSEQMQTHSDMLRDCRDILNKYGIDPILSNSALLGGVRDGDFIKWQYGKVLIVKTKEIIPFSEKIIKDLIKKGFYIKKYFQGNENFKITAKKEIFIIEITGYYLNEKKDFYLRKVGLKYKAVPVKFYQHPFKKIKIRGEEYSVPFDFYEYIKFLYGENWQTPIRTNDVSKFRNKGLYKYYD